MQEEKTVNNYFVWSVLSTVFCCIPFGVVALVYSSQAENKQITGDRDGAKIAADKAKLWCWVSLGSGLLFWISMIAIVIFTYLVAGSLDAIKK